MSINLRDELKRLKNKLATLENDITTQLADVSAKSEKWLKRDEEAENIVKVDNPVITINVGGKIFQTRLETLLSVKDTLFYKLILTNQLDYKKNLFIDRCYDNFEYILSYLRNKKLNTNKFTAKLMEELYDESKYFEISELSELLEEDKRIIFFKSFESNGPYSTAGTNKIEDINNFEDRTLMKGIVAASPGWIIFELNREAEFNELEVGGWNGNTGIFAPSNGSNSVIYSSSDKTDWIQIGTLPGNFGAKIDKIKVTISKARYIKVQSTTYLGLGYFRVLRKSD